MAFDYILKFSIVQLGRTDRVRAPRTPLRKSAPGKGDIDKCISEINCKATGLAMLIRVKGGTGDHRVLLSCTADGGKVDLYHVDDNSGRQKWNLEPTGQGDYRILVGGGVQHGRRYLSCTDDGSKVDLYTVDDGSGRQRWVIDNFGDYCTIRVAGGVRNGRVYLSCTADGKKVDLWTQDDASGRQRWEIHVPPNKHWFLHPILPICRRHSQVRVKGGTFGGRIFLSCTADGGIVDLYSTDDNSGRQKWVFEPTGYGDYRIVVSNGVYSGRRYLSCTPDGARVDLWTIDDGSGRQRWVVTNFGDFVTIRVAGGVHSGRVFLSCSADGSVVDLWTVDDGSGRQRWEIFPH